MNPTVQAKILEARYAGKSMREISEELVSMGYSVHPSSISRYLSKRAKTSVIQTPEAMDSVVTASMDLERKTHFLAAEIDQLIKAGKIHPAIRKMRDYRQLMKIRFELDLALYCSQLGLRKQP